MDYRSRRARMSCGHTVTPQSLTDWCDRQLQDGNIDLKCGVCGAVWPFDEVCKMALLTDKEKSTFEDKRLENLAFTKMNDKRVSLFPALSQSHILFITNFVFFYKMFSSTDHGTTMECDKCIY
ncbi:hypothetical protein NL108_018496 [Boleophthalmus pectinirostris]|nr:hypothetical protein NL108_018496 [Boleophthalmus pectinirostris]